MHYRSPIAFIQRTALLDLVKYHVNLLTEYCHWVSTYKTPPHCYIYSTSHQCVQMKTLNTQCMFTHIQVGQAYYRVTEAIRSF